MRNQDCRSKKIVFLANCILNANNKVLEAARYPGMFSEVIRILDEKQMGVIQMPCPETLFMGNQRWHTTRNLYDNAGYRKHCRKLAAQMTDYIYNYEKIGYHVCGILTCDGSPSCGITKSSYCEEWGGKPASIPRILVDQPGIYMEELLAELRERKLPVPPVYGLPMDDYSQDNETILTDFREYISNW